MEAYSSSYSSSNSTSSQSKGVKQVYPVQSHKLHSVRKSPAKSLKKAPVAPMPPTPVKVYKVDAINFRDVVQQLTGAPEPRQQLVQSNVIARAGASFDVPKQSQSSGDTCGKWFHDTGFSRNELALTNFL